MALQKMCNSRSNAAVFRKQHSISYCEKGGKKSSALNPVSATSLFQQLHIHLVDIYKPYILFGVFSVLIKPRTILKNDIDRWIQIN